MAVEGNLERWRAEGGARGETLSRRLGRQMEQHKNYKIQYMVAFIGRQLANQNTTTNQKQAAATEGSMEGIFDEQDAWGKCNAIILGAL